MTKILVVEDERRIRELLVDILLDAEYDVIEAEDGCEGLEKACREHPDIILLDVMMPAMDGFQVLEKLKADPAAQSIAVIMVTAKGQETDFVKAEELGAIGYICKPWDPDEVETQVKKVDSGTKRLL